MSRTAVLAALLLLGSFAVGVNAASDDKQRMTCYEYTDGNKFCFPDPESYRDTPPEELSWLRRSTERPSGILGQFQNFLDQLPNLRFRSFAAPNYSYEY